VQTPILDEQALLFRQIGQPLIKALAEKVGLGVTFREDNPERWQNVLNSCSYVPNVYTRTWLDYQLAYHTGQGVGCKDFSLVLEWDRAPVAVWPFSVSLTNTTLSLSSQGLQLTPPLIIDSLARNSRKSIAKLCVDYAIQVARALSLTSFESCEIFTNDLGLSDWHLEAMMRGASCRIQHELFLRTSDSWEAILKGYKKRLRYLINQAAKLWTSFVLDDTAKEPDAIWRIFKDLHFEASGRKTRSDDSWACQLEAIRRGEAFLVYLLNEKSEMIGGGYFTLTRTEALYAVGVYDRTLFDKPVGHLVQQEAIKEMIRRGIHWYKLGALPVESDVPTPTVKEISIGAFKRHFCSHTFPKLILNHTVAQQT